MDKHLDSNKMHAIFAPWPQVQIPPPLPWLHNMDRNIEERKQKQEEISPFLKTSTLKHRRYLNLQGALYYVPHNSRILLKSWTVEIRMSISYIFS